MCQPLAKIITHGKTNIVHYGNHTSLSSLTSWSPWNLAYRMILTHQVHFRPNSAAQFSLLLNVGNADEGGLGNQGLVIWGSPMLLGVWEIGNFHDNRRKLLICQNVGINHKNSGCNRITDVVDKSDKSVAFLPITKPRCIPIANIKYWSWNIWGHCKRTEAEYP